MEVIYVKEAQNDLAFWKKSGNKQVQKKIAELIEDIKLHPETGLGQPEQLRFNYTGLWSRRINQEHRIIYEIEDNIIYILSLKGHYLDK